MISTKCIDWWWAATSQQPLSVHDEVLDSGGQGQSVDVPPADPLRPEALPDGPPAPGCQTDGAGPHPRDVSHADLAVAPHRGDDGEDSLALQSAVGHPQVLAPGYEGEGAQVHVEDHEESVRDLVGVVLRVLLARHTVRVVVSLAAAQVPAPAVRVAAHQRLVAGGVEGRLLGGHPHHGVGPVLPAGPDHLEHVEAGAVVLPAPDTVGALSHGVTVEAEQVVLLHEDVEAAVVGVPGVLHLLRLVGRRGVQRHLHSDRQLVADNGAAADLAGAALLEVPVAVTFHLLHPPGDGGSHATVTPELPVRPRGSPGGLPGPVMSGRSLRSGH